MAKKSSKKAEPAGVKEGVVTEVLDPLKGETWLVLLDQEMLGTDGASRTPSGWVYTKQILVGKELVRVYSKGGEEVYIHIDACVALGYTNPSVMLGHILDVDHFLIAVR